MSFLSGGGVEQVLASRSFCGRDFEVSLKHARSQVRMTGRVWSFLFLIVNFACVLEIWDPVWVQFCNIVSRSATPTTLDVRPVVSSCKLPRICKNSDRETTTTSTTMKVRAKPVTEDSDSPHQRSDDFDASRGGGGQIRVFDASYRSWS